MRLRVFMSAVAAAAVAIPILFSLDPASVEAARKKRVIPVTKSRDLWATINVCDTIGNPDTIGIRGSMPARRDATRLYMRFRVQYLSRTDGRWLDVSPGADSGWTYLGVKRKGRVVEAGRNFTFQPPSAGGAFRLRGRVTYKWVRQGKVLARAQRLTEAGHQSTAGADPVGYSAAVCDIT
jgi:hypothetical protein